MKTFDTGVKSLIHFFNKFQEQSGLILEGLKIKNEPNLKQLKSDCSF